MQEREITLKEIGSLIGADFIGEDIIIKGLNLCNRISDYSSVISYINNERLINAVISNKNITSLFTNLEIHKLLAEEVKNKFSYFIVDNPENSFYRLHNLLYNTTSFYEKFTHKPIIGKNTQIHPSAIIEDGVIIGNNCVIDPLSIIRSGTIIGDNCNIGCNSVVGGNGFQIVKNENNIPHNIIHSGRTRIGNSVWIGDHVTICKSLFEGFVVVEDNCQIDNHCHIAHNCSIGKNSSLSAGVVLFGSAIIGANCWLAPGSMVMNRVQVKDKAFICANSFVAKDVNEGEKVIGTPSISMSEYIKREKLILKQLRNSK